MDVAFFSDFVLDRQSRQLRRGSKVVSLGARAFDVLDYLITHRAGVVSREEIMAAVWPDTIVGDNNLNVQVANLRRVLGPEAIVTVPRRGLRFALDLAPGPEPLPLPDRPSVVVLPFSTFGGDPELDWLADAFVEDVTTELSRFRDLFVVARNSAFAVRQVTHDLRTIARELGVRYVVEGSVRATPERVRVNWQLIDATSGGHVWAETFDRAMEGHFETQDRVARAIVSCLTPQIDRAESERVRALPPDDLTAQGLAQRSWTAISSEEMTYDSGPRNHAAALARQALTLDPRSGLAFRTLAWVAWWNIYHGTTESVSTTLADGIDAATRAIAIDPADHHARRLRALLHFMNNDTAIGLTELRLAHDMNPNCALTLSWLGFYEAINADHARGVALAQAGLRRSPHDPARGSMLCALGFAQFAAGDYQATIATAEAAVAEAAAAATPLVLGAIANVGAGRIDKAAELFRQVQQSAPKLAEARLAGRWLSSNADYLARAHTFFRVAAGHAPPEAADALRHARDL